MNILAVFHMKKKETKYLTNILGICSGTSSFNISKEHFKVSKSTSVKIQMNFIKYFCHLTSTSQNALHSNILFPKVAAPYDETGATRFGPKVWNHRPGIGFLWQQ